MCAAVEHVIERDQRKVRRPQAQNRHHTMTPRAFPGLSQEGPPRHIEAPARRAGWFERKLGRNLDAEYVISARPASERGRSVASGEISGAACDALALMRRRGIE